MTVDLPGYFPAQTGPIMVSTGPAVVQNVSLTQAGTDDTLYEPPSPSTATYYQQLVSYLKAHDPKPQKSPHDVLTPLPPAQPDCIPSILAHEAAIAAYDNMEAAYKAWVDVDASFNTTITTGALTFATQLMVLLTQVYAALQTADVEAVLAAPAGSAAAAQALVLGKSGGKLFYGSNVVASVVSMYEFIKNYNAQTELSSSPSNPEIFTFMTGWTGLLTNTYGSVSNAIAFANGAKAVPAVLSNPWLGPAVTALDTWANACLSYQEFMKAANTVTDAQSNYLAAVQAYLVKRAAYLNPTYTCPPPPPNAPPPPAPTMPLPPGAYSEEVNSHDPNEIIGPSGYGAAQFVNPNAVLPYTIGFENTPTATAPAQTVVVTEQIDPSLDAATFQLGPISFGSFDIAVPAGLTSYSTQVDATAALGVYVDVTASFDAATRTAEWTFTSIDPTTLDIPSNPLTGFLPPDNASGAGEGFVSYTIAPEPTDTTGTKVTAQAVVVFDNNAPIRTAPYVNTIDAGSPTSQVGSLPATTDSPTFTVSWSGSDGAGSGVGGYNVFVSDDGGPFQPFLTDTTATSAVHRPGRIYLRLLQRRDQQRRALAADTDRAQATIAVVPPPVSVTGVSEVLNKRHQLTGVTISFSGAVNSGEADNTHTYRLATAGKKGSFTAKNATVIKLKSAVYDGTTDLVTLNLKKPMALSKVIELLVYGTGPFGLEDSLGRYIDGDDNGQPGSNAVALIEKGGARISAAVFRGLARVSRNDVVDAVLQAGERGIRGAKRSALSLAWHAAAASVGVKCRNGSACHSHGAHP